MRGRGQLRLTAAALYNIQVVELPAVILLGVWFLMQLLNQTLSLSAPGPVQGVAWTAHVGGFIAGMALIMLLSARKGFRTSA